MTDPAFIILFVILLIFSIYLGFTIGSHWGASALTTRGYWLRNLLAVVICIVATAVLTLVPLLSAVPVGFLGGCLTGLKMGFGESAGPWKRVDRFFNVNKAHRDAAKRGSGAARRRRARAKEPEPDLMSVSDGAGQGTSSSADESPRTSGRNTRKKR